MLKYKEQKKKIKIIDFKYGEELTKFYLKSDVIELADVFENIIKLSIEENRIIPHILCESTWLYLAMWNEIN